MNIFQWEDGTVVERPYVEIDGTKYYVQDGTVSGGTPATATNMNEMQNILNNNMLNVDISGDNYVKLVDGTAICWGTYRTKTGSSAQNSQYSVTFTLTLPFVFKSGTCQAKGISGNPARKVNVRFSQVIENTDSIQGVLLSDIANYDATLDYLVIGKWK